MEKSIEINIAGNVLKISTHKWAKQSNGSALLNYKDVVLLVTANMKDAPAGFQDFLPLMCDFRENNYAAGKIPGGFFKREGKPSEREVLLSRMIDRPIRPLFPEGYNQDTQVIAMLLSADFTVDYDSLGIVGASAALLSSTIPFTTPVGAVKVGLSNNEFVINPGAEAVRKMDMVVQVAGTENDIVMLEAVGSEFSEDQFKQALIIAKEHITQICQAQKALINPDKIVVRPDEKLNEFFTQVKEKYQDSLIEAIFTQAKQERSKRTKAILDDAIQGQTDEDVISRYKAAFHRLEEEVFRSTTLKKRQRPDGRAFNEIRPISIELPVLPRAHGSALFTRGETQALASVTLGSADDAQRLDSLAFEGEVKRFMLHYNFPPFSVGEVASLRGTGRREVGHGSLAEKSLSRMMPEEDEFPYTIRIVSDILESNGSSSMATVCSATLALMNAGVPIKAPVAGIAMGLIKEENEFMVLTDIAGHEDHFGDMDFKIAGTDKGITAIQLDIKIHGLNDAIIDQTLQQAREARLFILERMKQMIERPAEAVSKYAPVIASIYIPTEKIKDLIGPGGKTIKGLIATYNVKINADDDGKVTVAAANEELGQKVIEEIKKLTASVEIGTVYEGTISRIEDYGFFAEILHGVTGLVHISEISYQRVKDIQSLNLKIGQKVTVKVINIDQENRVKLSMKAMEPNPNPDAPNPDGDQEGQSHYKPHHHPGDRSRPFHRDRDRGGDRNRGRNRF